MSVSFYLGKAEGWRHDDRLVRTWTSRCPTAKARMVLNALSLPDTDDLCGHMDRVQFANLCASWLQQHIGKQSAKIKQSVTRDTFGATFIDCGVPEGYINQRIRQLSEAARERQTMATSSIGVDPPEATWSPTIGGTTCVHLMPQNRPE